MNFLDARMMRHQQRGMSIPLQVPFNPIPHHSAPPPVVDVQPVQPIKSKNKKKEFKISDDKDQIIIDIIKDKPNIGNCRKALKKYVEISTEEHYEDLFD